jgi:K+-transporting ATPase KdpF subunit
MMAIVGNVVLGLISLALMAYLLYVNVRPGKF